MFYPLGINALEILKHIKVFVFDVDGVLTNGDILVTEEGELLRSMNVKDGYAMHRAIKEGYKIGVITAGKSLGVVKRLEILGVHDIFHGVTDKVEVYKRYIQSHNIDQSTVLYMGDDLPDFKVMQLVGLPTCPSDAAPEIMEISRYISPFSGGKGCVRDVIEKVMRLHGKWSKPLF